MRSLLVALELFVLLKRCRMFLKLLQMIFLKRLLISSRKISP
ncbi:unnamed protein product [Gongylonema pulchrum]|uniref:Uncharacterized protein n=1 Tax=Gongylonema pulchrum TaxID=637853 RepID=A0A183EJS0_9BILA|nr:unnamed protein product [Gongylonema pulchrum]